MGRRILFSRIIVSEVKNLYFYMRKSALAWAEISWVDRNSNFSLILNSSFLSKKNAILQTWVMPFEFYSIIWHGSCTKSLRLHSLEQQSRQNGSMICKKMQLMLSSAKWHKIVLVARMSISIVLLQRHMCRSEPNLVKLTSASARLANLDRQN